MCPIVDLEDFLLHKRMDVSHCSLSLVGDVLAGQQKRRGNIKHHFYPILKSLQDQTSISNFAFINRDNQIII